MSAVLSETLRILNEMSVYLLIGFLFAGLLHVAMQRWQNLTRLLAGNNVRSVVLSALFGAPLPVCSCGVLPAALALRKNGASKGAATSFLISTPETDIVSILLTYTLLGPLMAVIRPVTAVLTAITAGVLVNINERRHPEVAPGEAAGDASACTDECGADHAYIEISGPPAAGARRHWVVRSLHYGFVEFFDDIIGWVVFGVVVGGLITALIPADLLAGRAGGSLLTMLLMLVIGIPMYICAAASTPIAAGLIAVGLSPGAALIFLLAGPAASIASITVVTRFMGRRTVITYLATIAAFSLAAGLLLNWLIAAGSSPLIARATAPGGATFPPAVNSAASALLVLLSLVSFYRTRMAIWWTQRLNALLGTHLSPRAVRVMVGTAALLLYVGSGFFVVGPGERGMVRRFGRLTAANLAPGLHYAWPAPLGRADIVGVREVRRIELGLRTSRLQDHSAERSATFRAPYSEESQMLSGTEDLIDIKWVVQYRVAEDGLRDYLYGLEDAEQLLRNLAESAIREVIAGRSIDTLLTSDRDWIERTVRDELLQPALEASGTGLRVVHVALLDVHAPPEVHEAFRDVASADEDRITRMNEAQEYEERILPAARGEAAAKHSAARGDATAWTKTATGLAVAFNLRVDAYREAREVTRLRMFFESIDRVLPKLRKYIRPPAGGENELDLWLMRGKGGRTQQMPPMFDDIR